MVKLTRMGDKTAIVLRPNRSATWAQTKWLIVAFATFVGVIALGWAFVGAWVILPFAGAEVLLLAYLFHRVCTDTYKSERIMISTHFIDISRGFRRKGFVRLERDRTVVSIQDDDNNWRLPAFYLTTPEKYIQVGAFLNDVDRKALKSRFEEAGVRVCREHWWKQ